MCVCVCHRHRIWGRKEMKRFRAFVVSGVPARMPADVQRVSCAIEGGNYKKRA